MSRVINGKTYYITSEACRMAGISKATLFRWLKAGVLDDVVHKDRRGWRLFTKDDVDRIRSEATRFQRNNVCDATR